MLDYWLSICIFTPMVVAYWRGTWQLLDLYLWPVSENCLNAITSFSIGVGTITVLSLAQTLFTKNITSEKLGKTSFFIISRFYIVLFAFVGVNHWRGVWNIMECQAGIQWWTAGSSVVLAATTLALLRTLKSVIAPPFSIGIDEELDFFKATEFSYYYLADVLFTVVIVGSLVVVVWWGVWMLLDIFVFPESPLWSASTCVLIGIIVAIVCFLSQSFAARCSRSISHWPRILFEDIFLFIAEVGAINLWRGIWYLLDIYFIPDDPYLSNALSSFTGIALLIIMHNSNSILVKGILFNIHLNDGSGCYFHIEYIDKIITTLELYNAVRPNQTKTHDVNIEANDVQNYNNKERKKFIINETTEPLWKPQVISNGKVSNFVFFDRETVL